MSTLSIERAAVPARALNTALSVACVVLIAVGPAVTLFVVFFAFDTFVTGLGLSPDQIPMPFSPARRAAVAAVALVPVALVVYALLCAWRCFRSFARGEYLSLGVVWSLRGFAAGIFWSVVAAIVTHPVLSFLVTSGAGPDGHTVNVSVDSSQALTLLFAGIVWQAAAVMTRAVAIAEENAQFV
jgi:hypothetical protein